MIQRGFSLLETIIYIGLFGVLMSGVLVSVYQLIDGGVHNIHSVAVQEEGLFINRKMNWALSGASAVLATDPKTLIITRPDLGAQSPIRIFEDSGVMYLSRGMAAPLPLTTSELSITDMNITIVPASGSVPASVQAIYKVDGVPFVFKSFLHF